MIPLRVLLIEDSASDADLILLHLKKAGYLVAHERVETAAALQTALASQTWDILISDYNLPNFGAPAALALLQESGLDIPFIVASGTITEEVAIGLMRSGAADYLMKDRLARLGSLVKRELNIAQVRRERKEAQAALLESELRFRKLFEHSPYGVLLIDPLTTRAVEFNAVVHRQLGYTRAEFSALRIVDYEALETPEEIAAHNARVRGDTWDEFETRHRTKQGDLRTVRVSVQSIELAGKALFHCIYQDITEQKRIEEALRESEARWRTLVNASPAIVMQIDRDGIVLTINRTTLRRTKEEVIGSSIYPLLSPGERDQMKEVLAQVEQSRQTYTYESRLERPNGEVLWYENNVAPILDGDQVTSFIYNSTDITDRMRAEQALEKRIVALTRPLNDATVVAFDDLFNLDDIQRLQDEFAEASGVASIITRPDGIPITHPSNFCRLCNYIIRGTVKGRINCFRSDAVLGRLSIAGPTLQLCMSGGLWDAGAGISVGDRHIANWLIGQVRDETQTEEKMRVYAREIGADEPSFLKAFWEVPAMSHAQFEKVAQVLYTLANQLSTMAYQNVQQARFISEQKRVEALLKHSEERYHLIDEASQDMIYSYDRQGRLTHANTSLCRWLGLPLEQILGKTHAQLGFSQKLCDEWDELHHRVYASAATVKAEVQAAVGSQPLQYFEIMLNPIHDNAGAVLGIAGTLRNIQARKQAEAQINEQFGELRRWHTVTLGRESRILELKTEINRLLSQLGKPPRYVSVEETAHE